MFISTWKLWEKYAFLHFDKWDKFLIFCVKKQIISHRFLCSFFLSFQNIECFSTFNQRKITVIVVFLVFLYFRFRIIGKFLSFYFSFQPFSLTAKRKKALFHRQVWCVNLWISYWLSSCYKFSSHFYVFFLFESWREKWEKLSHNLQRYNIFTLREIANYFLHFSF